MKVYTKQGDTGTTSLLGGERVPKNDPRLEVYGTLDELNAFLGLAISEIPDCAPDVLTSLCEVQNQLFTVGGLIATPVEKWMKYWNPDDVQNYVSFLESQIDSLEAKLPKQNTFILPRGSKLIALLHVCRTVTRRAERNLYSFSSDVSILKSIFQYFNRLSDFFYILARYAHKIQDINESAWKSEK